MATKIKQITEEVGLDGVLFGSWLAQQGLDRQQQSEHLQSGWLERIARGVYKIAGSHPTLYSAVSCYNAQLGKQCIVGARSALDLRGFMHYVPMGKAVAFLFTDNAHKLPEWLLQYEWDMTVQYQTTSFLGGRHAGCGDADGGRTILVGIESGESYAGMAEHAGDRIDIAGCVLCDGDAIGFACRVGARAAGALQFGEGETAVYVHGREDAICVGGGHRQDEDRFRKRTEDDSAEREIHTRI